MLKGVFHYYVLVGLFVGFGSAVGNSCQNWRNIATIGTANFMQTFTLPSGEFLNWSNDTGTEAEYWNTFVALHAVATAQYMGVAPGENATLDFLEAFVARWSDRGWYSAYFDDMDWAIEALVRAAGVLKKAGRVAVVDKINEGLKLLVAMVESAWDISCCGDTPGGFWWDAVHSYKACASNAGTAVALCEYGVYAGDEQALAAALRAWTFWATNMMDANGQVADGISAKSGQVVWNVWTYNQGMMIGASACLASAIPNATSPFLKTARSVLQFVRANETSSGGVLIESKPCSFTDMDCLEFCGITFRFIRKYLRYQSNDANARALLKASVNSILLYTTNGTRYPNTWTGPPLPPGEALSLSSQTSALIAILEYTDLVCSQNRK